MYKVIAKFKDVDGKVYEIGDEYKGQKERIELLSTTKNRYKKPFIKKVEKPANK